MFKNEELLTFDDQEEETCYELWDENERIILIHKEIDKSLMDVVHLLMKWNLQDIKNRDIPRENRKPIKLLIDSYGGDAHISRTLIDVINTLQTPVFTVNIGNCLSAACYIFAAGHYRYALPKSSFMIHSGSWGCEGDVNKIRSALQFNDDLVNQIVEELEWTTDISKEMVASKGKDDWYFFAEEAEKLKLVDEIVFEMDQVLNPEGE